MIVTEGALVRHKKSGQVYKVMTKRMVDLEAERGDVRVIKYDSHLEKVRGRHTFVRAENLELWGAAPSP
jgi:hypothetical protein